MIPFLVWAGLAAVTAGTAIVVALRRPRRPQ